MTSLTLERRTLKPKRRTPLSRRAVLAIGLAFFGFWTIVPLAWIVLTSVKPDVELYREPAILPRSLTLEHYVTLFDDYGFLTYFANSLLVATGATVIAITVGVLAGYALAHLRFRGRRFLANVTVVTYLVPAALLFIPLFTVANTFGLANRALGLVPVYLIFSVPFCTWLLISHMQSIPAELHEASFIDGCSRPQSLRFIVLPLLLPALAVVALFAFTQSWNEFLYALVLISSDAETTVPVALNNFLVGDTYNWGPMMAGAVIASAIPTLIYLFAQRWVVSGLTAGATKG